MIDDQPGANLGEHLVFLGLALVRNDLADRLPDHLGRRIAEQAFGGGIPRLHDAVEILADDDVV